jgi:hypothetical protein
VPGVEGVFDDHGMPRVAGAATNAPGLYFCGQITVRPGSCAKSASRRSGSPRPQRLMWRVPDYFSAR